MLWKRGRLLTAIVILILVTVACGRSGASSSLSISPATSTSPDVSAAPKIDTSPTPNTSPAVTGTPMTNVSPTDSDQYPPLPASSIYNPGARAVYAAGLGKHVNLTYSNNGYTWTVHWVYADAVQTLVFYSITPPANSNDKIINSSLSVTEAAKTTNPAQSGGDVGSGVPISSQGSADFLFSSQDFQSITSQSDTISLVLAFSDIHAGTGVGQPGWVAKGTTKRVTVPFNPGRSIALNKQESLGQIQIGLVRVIVAPSGVMAMLSYPNMKSINIHQWKEVLANLSDGVDSRAQEQGNFQVPGTPSVRFPTPPPASLHGNWSLTFRPYDSSGNPSTDPSKWLSFTFRVGTATSAGTASSIPAEIQQMPKAVQLYKAGLGLSLNRSVKVGGVTITLQWIYADAQQVWAAYTFAGLQTNTGLQLGAGSTSALAGPMAAQRICNTNSIDASLDSGPAKRLSGSAAGGPMGGDTQGCLVSEDVYFSGSNLGAVVPVTVTIQGETSTAASSTFRLSAKVQMIPGRAAPIHQSVTVDGKTLTLDGINVAPTGVRLFFTGSATKLEYFPASPFTINGQPAQITTIGGASTRWSSTGDQIYGLSYDDPGWEKPWTITVKLITKLVPVPAYKGTPTVDLSQPETFTFSLPPASWDPSIVATPVP